MSSSVRPIPASSAASRQRQPHRVRVVVAAAARRVMQVVELADRGVTGAQHLQVGGKGQLPQPVRVQPAGEFVHPVAPGPERAAAVVGAAAQRPVEGVRMRVGEAGHDQPGEVLDGAPAGRPAPRA